MIKEMNKKAQHSNWFLIVLVLAVIVLVVVGLSITGVFSKITDLFDKVTDLETTAQACGVYASSGLKTSYCNIFQKVEINGEVNYATCKYLKDKGHILIDIEEINCGEEGSYNEEELRINFCEKKGIKKEKVNGELC
jgi:hypothetical protein